MYSAHHSLFDADEQAVRIKLAYRLVGSYFSKNKSKTLDAKIVNLTRIFVIVFFVLTVALNIFVAHLK